MCCYFKGNALTKLLNHMCMFTRHSGIHVLAELVCLLAELRYNIVPIVFSKDMPLTSYGCACVCLPGIQANMHWRS